PGPARQPGRARALPLRAQPGGRNVRGRRARLRAPRRAVADREPVSPRTRDQFPVGAAVTLEQLGHDPHPVLARPRADEPVSWLPALRGWLVTRHDLAMAVMRDATTFTVDDPRFSTAQVVGPSMLSLDGEDHARHRVPFAAPFRPTAVKERFAQ